VSARHRRRCESRLLRSPERLVAHFAIE
jgi:hypothetical protein